MEKELKYVNAFITATIEAFEQMVGTRPHRTHAEVTRKIEGGYGPAAIGALLETTLGPVILYFSQGVALKVASAFGGEAVNSANAQVLDATRELVNIIGGSAKSNIEKEGIQMEIGLPKTQLGTLCAPPHQKNNFWVTLQFECDVGQFLVQVPLTIKPAVASRSMQASASPN